MPDASGTKYALSPYLEDILAGLPKPDTVWELVPARDREGGMRWEYVPRKPSVYKYLEPLHGYRGQILPKEQWYYVAKHPGEKDWPRYAVERPPLAERVKRYRQALGIVYAFSAWEDLVPLVVFRRQVTNVGGILEIDHPLYLLIWLAREAYRPIEIRYFAERMPPRSNVRGMLYALAARELKRALTPRSSIPD